MARFGVEPGGDTQTSIRAAKQKLVVGLVSANLGEAISDSSFISPSLKKLIWEQFERAVGNAEIDHLSVQEIAQRAKEFAESFRKEVQTKRPELYTALLRHTKDRVGRETVSQFVHYFESWKSHYTGKGHRENVRRVEAVLWWALSLTPESDAEMVESRAKLLYRQLAADFHIPEGDVRKTTLRPFIRFLNRARDEGCEFATLLLSAVKRRKRTGLGSQGEAA